MKQIRRVLFFLSCVSVSALFGASLTLGTNTGGNSFPFGGNGTRYQEAYASSYFPGPIAITAINFFQSSGGNLYAGTYQVSLSTITTSVSGLSDTNFNSNLGANNTLFATVALSGTAPATLTFTGGPFNYDPSQGNLLVDIQIINPVSLSGSATYEDGNGLGPAGIARYHNFGAGTIGYGLVTRFDYGPVNVVPTIPTLSQWGMLLLAALLAGAAALELHRRTRGRASAPQA